MTAILGISAYYHDSAAALVVDGEIVAAAQEERFSRVKHDHRFPADAIAYCLRQANLGPGDVDYVGFYDKPFLKFERILETYLAFAPRGLRSFFAAMPQWLRQKLVLPAEIRRQLDDKYQRRIVFTEHHQSHAASAFFPSPFDQAAILTLDGVGEWATATLGTGRGARIELHQELRFPHSLGLLYSAFTSYCGFAVNSGEYKLMGLAPYGEPRYTTQILDQLVDLKADGSFRLDLSYFNYCQGLTMTSKKFHRLFGGSPRRPESPLTQRQMDVAASIQKVTEEIVLRTARHLHAQSGMKNLCLAGGVALNCVANGRVAREGPFERIWTQPAAGDAGGALGTALFIWYQLLGNQRRAETPDGQRASLLGPSFSDDDIRSFLESTGCRYRQIVDEAELDREIVDLIAGDKVVAFFQGRMEFGPRALGCRSILGDARSRRLRTVINRQVKRRESFRPFAPIVMRERAAEFFDLEGDSPYMAVVAAVAGSKRLPVDENAVGLDKLDIARSVVPAVTHVDGSARVQTVDPERYGRLHRLMARFEERTGCPVMINTSLNVRGEPMVCTPEDAYRCFVSTGMDALILESFVLLKEDRADREHQ